MATSSYDFNDGNQLCMECGADMDHGEGLDGLCGPCADWADHEWAELQRYQEQGRSKGLKRTGRL